MTNQFPASCRYPEGNSYFMTTKYIYICRHEAISPPPSFAVFIEFNCLHFMKEWSIFL